MSITDEAEEEIVVLQSIFCVGGEFSRPDRNVVTVKFEQFSAITFQIDGSYPNTSPLLSVSLELLTREQNERFVEELKSFVDLLPDGEQKMLPTIDFAREKYQHIQISERKETQVVEEARELIVIKIDHMRNSSEYVKTLERWCGQLGVRAVLVVSSDQGLIFLLEGDKINTSNFMINWKTTSIDVDSRGKPCKERMIQILYRSSIEKGDEILKEISEERFHVAKVDFLKSLFDDKKIGKIMASIL